MLRGLLVLAALAGAIAAAVVLGSLNPSTEFAWLGRAFLVVVLLGLAILIPAVLSLRADRRRIPVARAERLVERIAPFEVGVLMMFAASFLVPMLVLGEGLTLAAGLALAAVAVVGVAAAVLENLFPYVPGTVGPRD